MQHLSEVARILQHALHGEAGAVRAYAALLAEKLMDDGEGRQARILQDILDGTPLDPKTAIHPSITVVPRGSTIVVTP